MSALPFVVPFIVAFVTSLLLAPWAARVGRRLKAVDQPGRAKVHAEPVVRSGGLAIGVGLVAGAWAGAPLARILDAAQLLRLSGVTLAAAVIFSVGFIDDVMDLRPRSKFLGQCLSSLLIVMMALGVAENRSLWFALPITFALVLGAVNSLNLLDGMDGLAAGVTTVSCLALAAYMGSSGSPLTATWALALAGSAAAFLVYNYNPSSIFMGDGGAFLCGFGLAYTGLELLERSARPRTVLVLLLILAVPILDTGITAGRRLIERRPLAVADKMHIYHLLARAGLSHRAVFYVFVLSAFAFSTAAIFIGHAPRAFVWFTGGVAGTALLVVIGRLARRRNSGPL